MNSDDMLKLLGFFSLLTFVGSLIVVPWLIGRMRADYFVTHWREIEGRRRIRPALALAMLVLRNGLGLVLVVAGLAMLLLPGQGLLTILIGVCVMDFPGKQRMLQRLVNISQVRQGLNWIRRKRNREEFLFQ